MSKISSTTRPYKSPTYLLTRKRHLHSTATPSNSSIFTLTERNFYFNKFVECLQLLQVFYIDRQRERDRALLLQKLAIFTKSSIYILQHLTTDNYHQLTSLLRLVFLNKIKIVSTLKAIYAIKRGKKNAYSQ